MGIVGGFAVQEINQNTLCPVRLINDDTNPLHIKSKKDMTMVSLGSLPIGEAEVYFEAPAIFVLIVNIM